MQIDKFENTKDAFCKMCDDRDLGLVCPDGWAFPAEVICDWIVELPEDTLRLFKEMVSEIGISPVEANIQVPVIEDSVTVSPMLNGRILRKFTYNGKI